MLAGFTERFDPILSVTVRVRVENRRGNVTVRNPLRQLGKSAKPGGSVAEVTMATAADRNRADGLPERLRAATAPWHHAVEAAADIPGRVHTTADYRRLLEQFADLHDGLEAQLTAPRWQVAWAGIGVDIAAHCRAQQLRSDLRELGGAVVVGTAAQPFPTFGHALGCLYVLEGSALGGRVVARMVRAAIGAVPTAYLDGHGRGHHWQIVRTALRRFDTGGGNEESVLDGAVGTFAAFGDRLSRPATPR